MKTGRHLFSGIAWTHLPMKHWPQTGFSSSCAQSSVKRPEGHSKGLWQEEKPMIKKVSARPILLVNASATGKTVKEEVVVAGVRTGAPIRSNHAHHLQQWLAPEIPHDLVFVVFEQLPQCFPAQVFRVDGRMPGSVLQCLIPLNGKLFCRLRARWSHAVSASFHELCRFH